MELFHTPDTMPDAPNMGSNTRSKPAGLGNQVRELHEQGLLPLFDEDLLPTPTTGYSGREPGKWRAERKPSNVGNVRKITDLQVAMVELDGELPVLPTPSAVDGSGGSMQQSLDALREGRRQVHLTDLPRMLELEAEDLPLLRTPQAQVTEAKPGIRLEGRRPSDPQVGLADQVLADFHGPLLPTPVVNDMGAGKTPEQWDRWTDDLKARGYGNGNGHGNSLSVEVIRAEGEALLPTPQTRDATGGKPEAVNRGRGYGADLNDVAAAGLLDQVPTLLPTPCAVDRLADGNMTLGQWDESRRSQKERGVGSFGPRGDSLGAAVLRVHEGTVDERPDFSTTRARTAPEPLLPTPMSRDHQTGKRYALDPSHRFGPNLNDVATAGALGTDPVLPTPMARDHRTASAAEAMRNSPGLSSIGALLPPELDDGGLLLPTPMTNYARGGPETFGRWRPGARVNDLNILMSNPELLQTGGELLPTPRAQEFSSGSRAAHPTGTRKSGATLNEAVSLLPTPTTGDAAGTGYATSWEELTRAGGRHRLRDAVAVIHRHNEDRLLPTPAARDATGGVPSRLDRAQGAFLNDVAAAGLLPGPDKVKLLPTPTTLDHVEKRTTHAGGNPTLQGAVCGTNPVDAERLGVRAEGPLLPTPAAWDAGGGRQHTTRATSNGKVLSEAVREIPLMPTPQATDHMCGSTTLQGRIDSNRQVMLPHVVRDLPLLPTPQAFDSVDFVRGPEQLAEVRSRTGRSARGNGNLRETVVNELPLLPTPKAHDGVFGTPRTTGRPIEKSTHLQTIVSLMGLPDLPVLPTPKASDHKGTDSECEWSRNTPGLAAISVYYDTEGVDLLPTPTMADDGTRGSVHPERRKAINPKHSPELHELARHGFLPVDGGGDTTLMPTPQARDWKGAPGRNYKNRNLARDMERLAADQADPPTAEPEPEVVVNQHGDEQFTLFPTPNVGARNVRNSPGEMARRTPALGAVVADLVENGDPLLPTPQSADRLTGAPMTDRASRATRQIDLSTALTREMVANGVPLLPTPNVAAREVRNSPGEMARLHPALGAVVADLAELGDASRFHGTPLLPTPNAEQSRGSRTAEGVERRIARGDRQISLEDAVVLLPTPTSSQGRNETSGRQPGSRHNSGVTLNDVAFKGEIGHLLPTPVARDCNGRIQAPTADVGNNGRSVSLGDVLSRLPEGRGTLFPTPRANASDGTASTPEERRAKGQSISLSEVVGTLPMLPTPNTINRSSRRAMLGVADPEGNRRHWTGPGLEQVMEMLGGSLPREFDTVEEIPGSYREDLLPTPVTQEIGLTPEQFDSWADRLKGKGYNGNGRGRSLAVEVQRLAEDQPVFPTPMTVNRTSRRAQTGRPTSGPSRGGASYGLEDIVTGIINIDDEEILMPTPKTAQRGDCPSERERNSPDLAATTAHFPAGRWGKYGPAVERWEKLTRPAPAPTEPNKNGNPRLTARFSEWLLGWPEGWVTDPEIGIARTGQLRLIGNGVVPQQAATALVMLLQGLAEEREDEAGV